MPQPPNIILLVGEDVGLHLGCYGQPEARTPNLDRLASQGARYTHAYTVGPVCAPSRSCMVSGCYPWSIGTHHMRSTLIHPPRLFTHELRDAGYHVSWTAKTDFNFEPPADFASDGLEWWNASLPRQPFFAFRNFSVTHESSMWDRNPEGQERYPALIRELSQIPRTDPARVNVPAYLPDVPQVRAEIARHFDMLALADLHVGQTLDMIDRSSARDNTIIIYLTDHGRGLAREKRWCYDAGLHLPLLIRWPGKISPGTLNDRVVSWVDLAPTILSMAGVESPSHYQGRDFFAAARTHAFSGRDRMDEQFDRVRSVSDGRFRLIRNDFPDLPWSQRNKYQENQQTTQALRRLDAAGELRFPADVFMQSSKPAIELYDAEADPDMVHNLAGRPELATTQRMLLSALDAELKRFGDKGLIDETELIARGLVTDRLTHEYRLRIAPLPPPYAARSGTGCLTLNEAESRRRHSP